MMDPFAKLIAVDTSPASARRFGRRFWILLATVFLVRLVITMTLPIDLAGDETYYWEWGRHLDWGYYSKPPGIGWLMAIIRACGADSTAGIHVVSVVLGTLATASLYLLGRAMYGPNTGFLAALAFSVAPASAALQGVLTTDVMLVCCWGFALVSFWRFLATRGSAWPSVLALCTSLGAGALSKQMMLAFPVVAIVYLVSSRSQRRHLRRPGFWIAMCSPVVALLPPLWWNSRHDWITFSHTSEHFSSKQHGLGRTILHFLTFLASEAALISPIGWALLIVVLIAACSRWKRLGDRERFLVWFSAPGLAATLAMTTRESVNANWPAVFYLSATVLLAAWVAGEFAVGPRINRARSLVAPGIWVAIALTLIAYAGAYAIGGGVVTLRDRNPLAAVTGWRHVAQRVQTVREKVPRPQSTFVAVVAHRYLASELAFYLPDRPEVFVYRDSSHVTSQYDIWRGPDSLVGQDALLLVEMGQELPEPLKRNFERMTDLGLVESADAYKNFKELHAYLAERLIQWPTPLDLDGKSTESTR